MFKLSIITPTFNSANHISQNVSSILNQNFQNFEHIIIDNLSSDETLDLILSAYEAACKTDKLKIISEKDKGISDAFNKGIKNASGEIIVILNSDDYYFTNDIFDKVISIFENDSDCSFVHGDMLFMDSNFGSNIRKPLFCSVEYAMPFNHPTMFFTKNAYQMIGNFDLKYKYCMDFDLICRVIRANLKGVYLNQVITVMNSGGASDINEHRALVEYQLILEKYNKRTQQAYRYYIEKILRIKLKRILQLFKMNFIISLWRYLKWK